MSKKLEPIAPNQQGLSDEYVSSMNRYTTMLQHNMYENGSLAAKREFASTAFEARVEGGKVLQSGKLKGPINVPSLTEVDGQVQWGVEMATPSMIMKQRPSTEKLAGESRYDQAARTLGVDLDTAENPNLDTEFGK